jgi:hypothetical protein
MGLFSEASLIIASESKTIFFTSESVIQGLGSSFTCRFIHPWIRLFPASFHGMLFLAQFFLFVIIPEKIPEKGSPVRSSPSSLRVCTIFFFRMLSTRITMVISRYIKLSIKPSMINLNIFCTIFYKKVSFCACPISGCSSGFVSFAPELPVIAGLYAPESVLPFVFQFAFIFLFFFSSFLSVCLACLERTSENPWFMNKSKINPVKDLQKHCF